MYPTRFERARIIGARALQIAMGAPTLFVTTGLEPDPIALAFREFDAGALPLNVTRLPHDRD